MRTFMLGFLCGMLFLSPATDSHAQSAYGENTAGLTIYHSYPSFSDIYISSAPSCASIDSVEVHFSGTYPEEDRVTVQIFDEELAKQFFLWHGESGSFEKTAVTDIYNGDPVNGWWHLMAQDLSTPPGGEPLGQIDEWWIRVYYKCIPFVTLAEYANIVDTANHNGDLYAEEYEFDIIVSAAIDAGSIDVKTKFHEVWTDKVFWSNVWTVSSAFDADTMHFTDANFYNDLNDETTLTWDIELWDPSWPAPIVCTTC